jgi:hypothetical protein
MNAEKAHLVLKFHYVDAVISSRSNPFSAIEALRELVQNYCENGLFNLTISTVFKKQLTIQFQNKTIAIHSFKVFHIEETMTKIFYYISFDIHSKY